MGQTIDALREYGVIAVVDAPVQERLLDWGRAIAKGGIKLLGVPVTLPTVTELTDDLGDEGDLIIGVTGVVQPDQVSVAFAAGAEYVLTPIANPAIIEAAKERGIEVIAGAMTPTEVAICLEAGADLVAVHPAGPLGLDYFASVARQFRQAPLLAAGGIDIENAPGFLEAGALGAIVDRGVFPDGNEPAALEVISARALALTEVCADAMGTPKRLSLTDLLTAPEDSDVFDIEIPPPAKGGPASQPAPKSERAPAPPVLPPLPPVPGSAGAAPAPPEPAPPEPAPEPAPPESGDSPLAGLLDSVDDLDEGSAPLSDVEDFGDEPEEDAFESFGGPLDE